MASIQHQPGRKRPYRVFWRDQSTGKQRNKSFVRRKDAKAFQTSISAAENTFSQSDSSMTVAQAMDAWFIKATTTGLGGREPIERSTARKYDEHRGDIAARHGALKLCELDTLTCENIRDGLLEDYSRAYAKKIFTSFKSAIRFAVTQKKLSSNPAEDVNILISKRQRSASGNSLSRRSIPNNTSHRAFNAL